MVVARAMKTPDRHTCCEKRRATSAPVPHAMSLSRPRFTCTPSAFPASPAGSAPEPLSGKQRSSFPANEPGTRSCLKTPLTRNATRLEGCAGTVNRRLLMPSSQCPRFLRHIRAGSARCKIGPPRCRATLDLSASSAASPHALSEAGTVTARRAVHPPATAGKPCHRQASITLSA